MANNEQKARQLRLNFRAKVPPVPISPAQGSLNFGANIPRGQPFVPPAQGSLNFAAAPPTPQPLPAQGSLNFNGPARPSLPIPPPTPAQGSLNFNAPLPTQPNPLPAQGSFNFGPPRPLAGSFTPPATPVPPIPPVSNATGIAAAQQASRIANGLSPVRGGTLAAVPAQVPTAPPTLAQLPVRLANFGGMPNAAIAGLELARGVGDTAERTAAKVNAGQGFWEGLKNTVKENLARVADNPFGVASISKTVNALNEGRVPTGEEVNTSGRMVGNLFEPRVNTLPTRPSLTTSPPAITNPNIVTVTRPEGVATIRKFTGGEGAPLAARISPENPYGADVTNPAVLTGQVRVGAATDEEAARNLNDRALQDQAALAEVTRLNRATEALRELREVRSPQFKFGAESIGGGPDALDVASGRVINRDTPANVIAGRMQGAVEDARRFGAGRKAGLVAAEQLGNVYIADKNLQGLENRTGRREQVNPLDVQRYLLDQQRFGWQQGLDKERLALDAAKARNEAASAGLSQRKYDDERRAAFVSNFSYPDENAPTEQLAALTLLLADSTAGAIPPEIMAGYIQKAAEEAGVDWKNAPPKSLTQLGKRAMELATQDYRGK